MKDHVYIFSAPRSFGGGEVFLTRLAKLLKLQDRYVVISPPLPALQTGVENAGGHFVKLNGTGGIGIRLALLAWLYRNRKELRGKAATFVLNGRGASYFAPFLRLVIGIAPLIICHTEVVAKSANLKDFLYGAALRFARRLVAVSETVEAQHRQRWPTLQICAIPNWIDNAAPVSESKPTSSGCSVTQVAVVGRLAEDKGIFTVADVLAPMSNIETHFYGEGPLKDYLDNRALNVPMFKVHGYVADISLRLAQHAILVSASYTESFSYSVAEAINAGLLCVISDIPAHRELLGSGYPASLYFSPGDSSGFRRALDAAMNLLNDSNGEMARDVVARARLRLSVRNSSDKAGRSYRAVLLRRPQTDDETAESVEANDAETNAK